MADALANATPLAEAQKRAPTELKNVVDFLRGKNGPKVRRGILNGKRIDYFKGKTAVRVLTSPAYQKLKKVPPVKDEEEAKALMTKLLPQYDLPSAFFLRVERPTPNPPPPSGTPKTLLISQQQSFDLPVFYAWFYEGSQLTTILGGVAMVLVIFAGVMFPLWPAKLRLGVWYLSILLLILIGLLIALAIVRAILFVITWATMKRAIWIFPNLFEDVGFFESFVPTWAYDEPKKKKKRVKREKSHKAAVEEGDGDAGDDGEGAAEETSATTTALPPVESGGVTHRQAATVEEAGDDEI